MQEIRYFCADCNNELLLDERPCHNCGSSRRNIHLQVIDGLSIYDQLKTKLKRKIGNKTKVIHEQKVGDELYRKTHEWRFVHRVMDHIKNKYTELIVDKKSGKTIISKSEKLSEHQGHGSAKYKKPQHDQNI